ncbi:GNAT family N-acetyltransferase [Macrococcus animalis]|uniref:GNAT family N-acetyltransferase n=1 Tax=Macrococcus animalis TaxID=3395467 RepID=UPI0039BEA7B7
MYIRKATPNDSSAELNALAIDDMSQIIFGSDDYDLILEGFSYLFNKTNNRFSYQYTDIAVKDGKIAGAITALPLKELNRTALCTILQIIKWKKLDIIPHIFKYMFKILPLTLMKEGNNNEYHISMIAVKDDFQGTGVASSLLNYAERKAIKKHYKNISLTVKINNEQAKNIYQQKGYKIVGKIKSPVQLYRMRKSLN